MNRLTSKGFHKWLRIGIGLIGVLMVLATRFWGNENLELVFCDVGQGDASLVVYGDFQMLVDGGPNSEVLRCLRDNMGFWDRKIELVVLTHPQADHMTGLIEVFDRYEVEKLVAVSAVNQVAEYRELRQRVMKEPVESVEPVVGKMIKIGELELKVVWPETKGEEKLAWKGEISQGEVLGLQSFEGDVNQMSVVLLGSWRDFDFLLTGDIAKKEEEMIKDSLQEVEVLKVAHHGSKYSSSEEFLKLVSPEVGVISVGKRNRFGHPTQEAIERLKGVGAKVLRTDELGEVKVVSDGLSWWIEGHGRGI